MRPPRHHRTTDEDDVSYAVGCLDNALSFVLEAREALAEFVDVEPPVLALETALRSDQAHQRSRDRLDERAHALREAVPPHLVQDVLAYQEAIDDVAFTAVAVGYTVGVTVASGTDA